MILPSSAPSAQGVDAAGIIGFLDAARDRGLGLHGLAIARHGHMVVQGHWEPYSPDRLSLVYSLSKSLTATAVGFLVQEGRLRLDAPILDHLPVRDRASVDERWQRVEVRHCLSMTVGHDVDAWPAVAKAAAASEASTDWVDLVLRMPPEHEPGTVFTYNQVATFLLSAAVTHVTGERVVDVLRPRLFDVLGIGEVLWHTDPSGRDLGFSGAHLRLDDILAFAQFYLDRGVWQGRRVLEDAWFEEATRAFGPPNRDPEPKPDWHCGYGYSFWIARHGYRGDGAFGQFAIVLPEQDAVVAITGEETDMQAVLDAVWAHLLPALGGPAGPVTPAVAAADADLQSRLDALAMPPVPSAVAGPDRFRFARAAASDLAPSYAAVAVARAATGWQLTLETAGEELVILAGDGTWHESVVRGPGGLLPVVASAGWVDHDCFRGEVLLIETPHRVLVDGSRATGEARLSWREPSLMGDDLFDLAVRRPATETTTGTAAGHLPA
ncbi:MAG TPA: serine hydrolase [Intrasporangium sp.]|uniref:serine hydrolase domain-containing protein n=1 Tax=Intrasporangium sp. TaxID=1925024 RepID=UPI002D772C64|nr:serine hydrolase [Intrasporangium sp.]HET7398394.1 serine hydrolase [Intrasporangium sp.]